MSVRSASPPDSANFDTSVLPISSTSGGLLPASAVVVFSWMPSHCWISIFTVVPGCAAVKSALTALITASGALPFISQTVMSLAWEVWAAGSALSWSSPQPATPKTSAATTPATAAVRLFRCIPPSSWSAWCDARTGPYWSRPVTGRWHSGVGLSRT